MLILTRRVGETVMIGNDVTVTVLGVKGNQVRVGINAPKNVAVHREEIAEKIKKEQVAAGKPDAQVPPGKRREDRPPEGHGPGCECQVCVGEKKHDAKPTTLKLKGTRP